MKKFDIKDIAIVVLTICVVVLTYTVVTRQNTFSEPQNQGQNKLKAGAEATPYEKNEIKNTIVKRAAEPIQTCFKDWVKDKKDFISGRIQVDWTIQPDGKASKTEVIMSEIPSINDCVLKVMSSLEYPPPPDGKPFYVAHKFLFTGEKYQPPVPDINALPPPAPQK